MSDQLIVTLTAALLPIFLTTAIAWLQGRARENRRVRMIDVAHKHIQFLNEYLAVQSMAAQANQIETIKQSVMAEVEAIRAELIEDIQEIETQRARGQNRNIVQRYLLFYRIRGFLANSFRALFYLLLLVSVFMSTIISSMPADSIWVRIIGALIFALPLVLLTVLFRWLAIAGDQRPVSATEERPAGDVVV